MKCIAVVLVTLVACASVSANMLPEIDLGYVRQRATEYNSTTGIYVYKNIRYARPPTGELRFREPKPPLQEPAGTISDGTQYRSTICPQQTLLSNITPSANGYSEDCLFLDIYSPGVFKRGENVPVLVWIYGGAYVIGSKDDIYLVPTGLFRATKKPMIFVALNYRLGAFGWSAPPSEKSVVPNLGLYDAKAALEWIRDYIPRFGGNAADVTVFGESAGGGVIMHLITAYGGLRDPLAFQKAILQSPGFAPMKGNMEQRERTFNAFMKQSNCSDLKCLREAPTSVLIAANNNVTQTVGMGPVVDDDFVPDLPSKLILDGRYHKTLVSVIAANNDHEGRVFVPSPVNVTKDTFDGWITRILPYITESSRKDVHELYSGGPSNESLWKRTTSFIGDVVFACNAQIVASSYATHKDAAYRYVFSVPPGGHGEDVPYSFYSEGDNPSDILVTSLEVAHVLPNIITSLAVWGVPQVASNDMMEKYGSKEVVLNIGSNGTSEHTGDPWRSRRCTYWQNGLFIQG